MTTALTTIIMKELTQTVPPVHWREALETWLNTLSSPRTRKAYERAVREAMEALGVGYVANLTPPVLAQPAGRRPPAKAQSSDRQPQAGRPAVFPELLSADRPDPAE